MKVKPERVATMGCNESGRSLSGRLQNSGLPLSRKVILNNTGSKKGSSEGKAKGEPRLEGEMCMWFI